MWIGRKEYEDIMRRLSELEQNTRELYLTARETEKDGMAWWEMPVHKISVKDVVEKILCKLGMTLVAYEGRPARVEMQKKK